MKSNKVKITVESFGDASEYEVDGAFVIGLTLRDDGLATDHITTGMIPSPAGQKAAISSILNSVSYAVKGKQTSVLKGLEILATIEAAFRMKKDAIIASWAKESAKDPDFNYDAFKEEAFEVIKGKLSDDDDSITS